MLDAQRLLDEVDRPQPAARLTALLAGLGAGALFTQVAVVDQERQEATFRYVTRAAGPAPLPAPPAAGWVWSEADHLLYRALPQPVLAAGRPATLWLYVPMDAAVMRALSTPETLVELRWQGRTVARSVHGEGLAATTPAPVVSAQLWSESGPEVRLMRRPAAPFSQLDAHLLSLAAGMATALLGWLLLGRWLSRHASELMALQRAAASFETRQRLDADAAAALQSVRGSAGIEVAHLAESLQRMMLAAEQAQVEIRRANAELEQRVKKRTAELEQARDDAVRALHVREQFLASISHELRTPLAGLLGGLELVQEAPLPARQRHFLQVAHQAGEALKSIINEVLDYSKIEAGHLVLAEVAFRPLEVASEVVQLFAPQAEQAGQALRLDSCAAADLEVAGDPLRLRQVLLNLVGNALKFTPSGGSVVLRLHAEQPPTGGMIGLVFEVQDTGPGIDEQDQRQLFTPFFQTAHGKGGTGLGLAICKRLIEAMGGRISVRSRRGEGCCFRCDLALPACEARGEAASEVAPTAPPAAPAARGTVLLVEDNPVNRVIGVAMLQACGVTTVLEAENGEVACELLQRHPVDLVLMDCQMPVLDGYEATRRLRAAEAAQGRPRTPVVALTATVLDAERQRCLEVGMDAVLAKPYSREQLAQLLAVLSQPGALQGQVPGGAQA